MPKKILIIDDDPDFALSVRMILESRGFEVHTAANATEAEAELERGFQPDGMILDVMMSGKGEGMIFARKIRKNASHKHIPILMLTGMSEATGFRPIKEDPRDPIFLPVDVYLEKPVLPETLLQNIEGMLSDRKS